MMSTVRSNRFEESRAERPKLNSSNYQIADIPPTVTKHSG